MLNKLCQSYPPKVANIIVNSLRISTRKQYAYYLQEYQRSQGDKNFDITPGKLMTFLSYLFDRGVGYSGINTARSALSSVSTILGGCKVGENPTVCRFMKGIFNLRPSLPRYVATWDPDIAIRYLDTSSENLNLLELSRKVVFLLTLFSGQRVSTVSNISVNDLRFSDSGLDIMIGLVKQSRPGKNQQPLKFNVLIEHPDICVVKQVKEYIKRTENLRNSNCKNLFITTTKPHKGATVNTLANWIKNILTKCKLSNFSAHSLRSASTSAALRSGLPIDRILAAAGWSNLSTFRKFYNKPIVDVDSFDQSVLKSLNKP